MLLDSERRVLGNFNAHLHDKLLIVADEAVWAGGKAGLGALKRMITERTLDIEPKGLDVIQVKNMMHMIVTSNEDWVVPTAFDDRRFAIFEVANDMRNNRKFFKAVHDQLFKQGGLAAMLYDLQETKIDVDLWDIPDTDEKRRQKEHTMDVRESWWCDQLLDGSIWDDADVTEDGNYAFDPKVLYEEYVSVVFKADKRISPGTTSAMTRFLRKFMPEGYPAFTKPVGTRLMILPSLDRCRREFEDRTSLRIEWGETDEPGREADVPF